MRGWAALAGVLATVAAAAPTTASGAALVPLAPAGSWGSSPVHATAPPGDSRLFVVERAGALRAIKDGELQATPFLTVPNVDTVSERGLLSIAFPPDYVASGLFYVFYTALAADALDPSGARGDVRIVEYRRSATDPDLADPASARLVLKVTHPAGNHNGGQLAFGPDGLLYVTIGDGANGSNAQSLATYLGKVLRIDPRDPPGPPSFSVPASNPFAGSAIYALGLRNPFRASFAPGGALVVADVGLSEWEEVNAGDLSGKNFGWPGCEGACSPPDAAFTDPVFQYPNDEAIPTPPETTGCAILGGYVVRDPALAGLTGRYLYGDLCRPDLRTLDLTVPSADPRPAGISLPAGGLLGFGEDAGGCVYVMTTATAYRVADDAGAPKACPSPSPAVPPSPAPPPAGAPRPAAPRDTTPPRLRLRVRRQRLRRHVQLFATCSEACTLRARGVLKFSRRRKASSAAPTKLRAAKRQARAGVRVRLRLKVGRKVRRGARRALKARRRVFARVRVTATDSVGNVTANRVRVRLTR